MNDAEKLRAAETGAQGVSQFWGDVSPDMSAQIGEEVAARLLEEGSDFRTGLDDLFAGDNAMAGQLGLDSILHELMGKHLDGHDVEATWDGLKSLADGLWSGEAQAAQAAEASAEAGAER